MVLESVSPPITRPATATTDNADRKTDAEQVPLKAGCTVLSPEPSRMHKMLAMIETRVAGVETTMAAALDRLDNILTEICDRKVHGDGAAATTTPTRTDQKDVGCLADVRSHSHPENHSVPVSNLRRERIVVSDSDSYSAQHSGGRARASPTGEPPAKRATRVPRMKSLACHAKIAVARTLESLEKAAGSDSAAAAPTPPRYKDPPGYEHVADFGGASPTEITVPILQPRRHAVSIIAP